MAAALDRGSLECASAAIRSAAAAVCSCSRLRSLSLVFPMAHLSEAPGPGRTAAIVTPLSTTRIHPPKEGSPAQYLSRICPGRLTPQRVTTGNDGIQLDCGKSSRRNGLDPNLEEHKELRKRASANFNR